MKAICIILIVLLIGFIQHPDSRLRADWGKPEQSDVHITGYDFTQKDSDYEETPLRRFEIVFLISLPVSLLITFLGIESYRVISGKTGAFTSIEYQYLILSTLGISFIVALRDNQVVFLKERF